MLLQSQNGEPSRIAHIPPTGTAKEGVQRINLFPGTTWGNAVCKRVASITYFQ